MNNKNIEESGIKNERIKSKIDVFGRGFRNGE